MSRTIEVSVESAVTVEQVFAAFCDESYWLARMVAFGAGNTLDGLVIDEDGVVRVNAVQDLAHELLPPMIAKLYPRDLMVVRTETWQQIDASRVDGHITVVTDGVPASADGNATLTAADHGSQLELVATVNFNVPLLGGRAERYLASQLGDGLRQIQRFTTEWITTCRTRSHEAQG